MAKQPLDRIQSDMLLHKPTVVFPVSFFLSISLCKPSNHKHSSSRGVYSPNISSCHSFNSIFGYLHKMTHNLMKLLQPREWENYGGPIITCNLHFDNIPSRFQMDTTSLHFTTQNHGYVAFLALYRGSAHWPLVPLLK